MSSILALREVLKNRHLNIHRIIMVLRRISTSQTVLRTKWAYDSASFDDHCDVLETSISSVQITMSSGKELKRPCIGVVIAAAPV